MTLPPTAEPDASAPPPSQSRPTRSGWRRLLDNEPLLYSLTFCVMVAGCLLVPRLLNNMIFVFVMLMLGVCVVPLVLKKVTSSAESEIDRKGADR